MSQPTRILYVCMGNICRSPMAEGIFRERALAAGLVEGKSDDFISDSAATSSYHIGDPPDGRARALLAERGIDISGLRARQVVPQDFDDFDHILAMDRQNMGNLDRLARSGGLRPKLFLDYATGAHADEVPDPYYGSGDGFEICFELIENAVEGILKTHFNIGR